MTDEHPLCGSWATVEDALGCGGESFACDSEGQITDLLECATWVVYNLTRRKYPGLCTDTVRPCAAPQMGLSPLSWGWHTPWGGWCCNRAHNQTMPCACSEPSKITLGAYPIRSITEVEIDGALLSTQLGEDYDLLHRRWLIRMADADGHPQCWPTNQRLDLPLGEVGTWAVTFTYGAMPPRMGTRAVVAYAKQLAKACACKSDCVLPSRVQSVARQGMSMVIQSPDVFLATGFTGVSETDEFIKADRFGDNKRGAVFINPDQYATVGRLSGNPYQS